MHKDEKKVPGQDAGPPHVDYFERDLNLPAIFKFLIGMLVVGIIVHVLMWGMFKVLEVRSVKNDPELSPLAPREQQRPPEPTLQKSPANDFRNFRTEQGETVSEYKWIDKNAGTVQIPVSEAMKRLVETGALHSRSTQRQTQTQTQTQTAPQETN